MVHKWDALTNISGSSMDSGIVESRPEIFKPVNANDINLFISQLGKPNTSKKTTKVKVRKRFIVVID